MTSLGSFELMHACIEQEGAPFTIENRGAGWYLYAGDEHGNETINFCPCCGMALTEATDALER